MRCLITCAILIFISSVSFSKEIKDTVYTRQGDKIILSYVVATEGNRVSISVPNAPRIIPSESLRKECKGDLTRLKTVIFDRVGNTGNVKWKGITPSAFMVPSGVTYDKSADGYYIFGESAPLAFTKSENVKKDIRFPVYIALYEKKQTYKILIESSRPLNVTMNPAAAADRKKSRAEVGIERIAVTTSEELEADNDDVAKALSSIKMIRMLLEMESELPFSQTLTMEVQNLRILKDRIKDDEVIEKINELFLDFNQKEKELKEAERQASLSAQAQQQALLAQQKQEEEERQKAAEEQARIQEEKQQKRTFWMIAGAVVLGIIGFICNAVFKHFRDMNNQKSIMQMQESIVKQAEHEATRRSREIVRNNAHQMANKGKGKLRESIQKPSKPKTNSKIKSI